MDTKKQETALTENHGEDEVSVDAEELAYISKMSDNLHLVLRMAAMGMLYEEEGGFVMNVGRSIVRMPDAKTLFEAYLVLEEMYSTDFSELEHALDEPWMKTAINMVLSPDEYVKTWRALRMRIIEEAVPMLRKYSDEQKTHRDSKYFALLCIHICDKVIGILCANDSAQE